VGLGGRLDATNVISPEMSVITSIGFDHTEFLGDTLAKIAKEKAGIIKPKTPIVIGYLPHEAEEVIRRIAAERNAPLASVREVLGHQMADLPQTNLSGEYQRRNAATAMVVAERLSARWKLTKNNIVEGLLRVDWPGRWQTYRVSERTLILDCSHNAEGMMTLAENLDALAKETGRLPVVVAGALGSARARALMQVISTRAKALYLVEPSQRRATSTAELKALVPESVQGLTRETEIDAIFPGQRACCAGEPEDVVVVTGSIYLAGEVLARLQPERGPYEGHLQDF
jgi:dihydrofolate synthase/folylpolyglutamate synthase